MTTLNLISEDDQQHWKVLFGKYADFYHTTIDADTEATVWSWIQDQHNDFWCVLAKDDAGKAVGFAQYQLMHRSLSGAMVCYLSDLYVDPAIRGHGVGRQLIDHVFGFARGRGIGNVRWLTQENNYAGRALYDGYARKSDFILYSVPVDQTTRIDNE